MDDLILIYSAGGNGREIAWMAREAWPKSRRAVFVEDDATLVGQEIHGMEVMSYMDALQLRENAAMIVAVGNPAARRKVRERCAKDGFSFMGAIDPSARIGPHNEISADAVICATSVVTCDVVIGEGCILNRAVNIGHDTVLGSYVSIAPGATLGGFVEVGDGSYIGSGATIINGTSDKRLRIGRGAIVGAGACVIRDVPDGTTVGGVPARLLHPRA